MRCRPQLTEARRNEFMGLIRRRPFSAALILCVCRSGSPPSAPKPEIMHTEDRRPAAVALITSPSQVEAIGDADRPTSRSAQRAAGNWPIRVCAYAIVLKGEGPCRFGAEPAGACRRHCPLLRSSARVLQCARAARSSQVEPGRGPGPARSGPARAGPDLLDRESSVGLAPRRAMTTAQAVKGVVALGRAEARGCLRRQSPSLALNSVPQHLSGLRAARPAAPYGECPTPPYSLPPPPVSSQQLGTEPACPYAGIRGSLLRAVQSNFNLRIRDRYASRAHTYTYIHTPTHTHTLIHTCT
jgi:hypothetical protein